MVTLSVSQPRSELMAVEGSPWFVNSCADDCSWDTCLGCNGNRGITWTQGWPSGLLQSSKVDRDSDDGSGYLRSLLRVWQSPGDAKNNWFLRHTLDCLFHLKLPVRVT